ncbi:MAG: hypothetical protein KJO98_06270, partial [Rhodothermia bacterium]|nr:hypothetical protein [Rhodothermia bacterium]
MQTSSIGPIAAQSAGTESVSRSDSNFTFVEFDPLAVRAGIDVTTLRIGVMDTSIVQVLWESRNSFTRRNVGGQFVTLLDDGTHGDATAGDGIFTIDSLLQNADIQDTIFEIGPAWLLGYPNSFRLIHRDGHEQIVSAARTPSLITIDASVVPIPNISRQVMGPGIDHTNYVLSITDSVADSKNLAQRFYEYADDTFDFLFIASLPSLDNTFAGYYESVSNNVQGIGLSEFDSSSEYGSSGTLQGVIRLFPSVSPGLLNHELLHRWAVHLDSSLDLGMIGHWGIVQRPTSGFGHSMWGSYPNVVDKQFDDYFRAHPIGVLDNGYSDLELYLMGLMSSSSVESPIRTLISPSYVASEPICCPPPLVDVFEAEGLREVDVQEILDIHGPRIPDTTSSQKSFRAGLVVAFSRSLSDLEFAYYDYLMRVYEELGHDKYQTFASVTHNRAVIATRLFNSDPVLIVTPPDTTIETTAPFVVDLNTIFADNDSDPLAFEAESSDTLIAQVSINQSVLTVTRVASGTISVLVTARDAYGGSAQVQFDLTYGSIVSVDERDS